MADVTKTTYQERQIPTWSKQSKQVSQNLKSNFKLSKNLALGFSGIAFMTIWLILSIQTDLMLLGEILPAYIIITALLFMRALDESKA